MPAGSPIDTAIAMGRSGPPAGLRSLWDGLMTRSTKFDVRILSEVAKVALGQGLEFLRRQLFHRFFARFLVGLDGAPGAHGVDLDARRRRRRWQHVAVLGAEQHRARGFGNGT